MSRLANSVMKTALALLILTPATAGFAQAPPELQAKLNIEIKQLVAFSADPKIVDAVKAYNATPLSPEAKAMTNENWRSLTIFDPFVRTVGKSPLSEFLKGARDDVIIKVFVSGADGGKVGFDSKTEHWTHKGIPKHEVPMSGKTWIGTVKLDDSTGLQTIQVGLPVLSAGKPIGSIVFGLRADKLH
ncbi:MAG: hypothetical protein WAM78_01695 [Candidatus Sulfotelmatobacter sp.]